MSEFSWVTLATNDSYSLGALVLAHSLKRVGTRYQLVVMVTPGVTQPMREKLAAVFDLVFEVNILDSKDERNLLLLQRPELGITFTKLHCWRLTQFKKCVFLDADTLVLQNCDELFEREEFSAAPDVGWPDCFNSGVFVYAPSDETFNSLLTFALERGSFDGGDQGLLNLYFSDWAHKDISKHLPFIYNMCSTACYSYLPAFKQFGEEVKIVHFIGNSKPWLQYFNSETLQVSPTPGFNHLQMIFDHWWNLFCAHVHSNLAVSMGGLAGAFAQMTLREPKSASQGALEEHLRRQGWEAGRIDYLGQDSFDNVWKKICQTISAAPVKEPSPPKQLPVKEPSSPKQIVEQPVKQPSPPKEQSPPKQVEVQPFAPAAAPESTPAPVVATSEFAPVASIPETPVTPAPVTSTPEGQAAPAPEARAAPAPKAQAAPAPEAQAAPAPETPASEAPTASAPIAPIPETPAPVEATPKTSAPVAQSPETPAPIAPTPETATPTPETPAVPEPVAPTLETPVAQAAPETVSPVEPTPVPDTTPIVAAEPAVPVAPSAEPTTPAAATETVTAVPTAAALAPEALPAAAAAEPAPVAAAAEPAPVAAREPVSEAVPATTPEPVSAAPDATPAPIAKISKPTETKAEEEKPKEAAPAAVTEETKTPSEDVAPPTITETPATPQTPDATKGDIKPAPTKPAVGQSSETPVPPPRKSGKNGGATTKKSSKKK